MRIASAILVRACRWLSGRGCARTQDIWLPGEFYLVPSGRNRRPGVMVAADLVPAGVAGHVAAGELRRTDNGARIRLAQADGIGQYAVAHLKLSRFVELGLILTPGTAGSGRTEYKQRYNCQGFYFR